MATDTLNTNSESWELILATLNIKNITGIVNAVPCYSSIKGDSNCLKYDNSLKSILVDPDFEELGGKNQFFS